MEVSCAGLDGLGATIICFICQHRAVLAFLCGVFVQNVAQGHLHFCRAHWSHKGLNRVVLRS